MLYSTTDSAFIFIKQAIVSNALIVGFSKVEKYKTSAKRAN
jgi:hypothetical protein